MVRTRTNVEPGPQGTSTRFGWAAQSFRPNILSETCEDHPGPGDCMPLRISRTRYTGGIINSHQDNGYWTATFRGYPADAISNGQLSDTAPIVGLKPDSYYATQAVARTNPSRPYVDVPVSLLELGDAALLLKQSGETLIEQIAGAHIKKSFGTDPLISDLFKLQNFADQVNRRIKEIEKLKSPKGLRRTVVLDQLIAEKDMNVVWQSFDWYLSKPTKVISTVEIKGHVRWLPAYDFSKIPEPIQVAWAKRAVLGLDMDLSTLWELTPWSWLIDWCFSMGEYLKAQRNIIPATCHSVTLTRHTTHRTPIPYHADALHSMSGGDYFRETKERFTAPVAPTAHFPFLTGNQMGIVASLAVTRR